jgi:hypothetical protein
MDYWMGNKKAVAMVNQVEWSMAKRSVNASTVVQKARKLVDALAVQMALQA